MSDIQAFTADDIPDVSAPPARVEAARAAPAIEAEIVDAAQLGDLDAAWDDLLPRADAPNPLMHPAMVQASATAFPEEKCCALLAWKSASDGGGRCLAGIWALAIGRPHQSAFPIRVLNAPPGPQRYVSVPVIDRACLDETLHAMLDAVAADRRLPDILALDAMATDGETMKSLLRVLAARGSAPCILQEFRRPKLASELDGKAYLEKALSGSSRKKLRQHRRRLAEKGALTYGVVSEPEAVAQALEDFMRIEAAGWKGRQGTALLCDIRNATYMRNVLVAMAKRRCASVHALRLDGQPVSMQIVVRAGPAAFTWKTAYDERYQDFSPGMLLLEDYTAAFLADKSIRYVDSCSYDDSGYMSTWTERQPIADLWIDARRNGGPSFRILASLQKRYRDLRALTKAAYLALGRR